MSDLSVVTKIADAVLYEGYILYPYRASAVKNRQRFNFGTLYPPAHSERSAGAESSLMRTECLVEGRQPVIDLRVRFLHLRSRSVGRLRNVAEAILPNIKPDYESVDSLTVGDETYVPWQEAVEREVTIAGLNLTTLDVTKCHEFIFPAGSERELLHDEDGRAVGLFIREYDALSGAVEITAQPLKTELFKLTISVINHSSLEADTAREDVLLRSLLSAHTILSAADGQFVSLLDPPEEFVAAVASCQNQGTWPVLVGTEGARDVLLSSPIILYDYPQVAPESAGDFFDGCEIDEMLALRVMTLTEDERREMRGVDRRARQILERVDALPQDHLLKLHGALRGLKEIIEP